MIVEVAPHEGRMSRRCARAGVSSGWWSMTRSTSPNASSKKLGWASTIATMSRSEEHTSELQSLAYLVCRLLLEKKKNQKTCMTVLMSTQHDDYTTRTYA